MTAIRLRPSAKINLTLRVGPMRRDGFHDVRTVMQSIALSDTLTVTPRRGPFSLVTSVPDVPADHRNLVWQAAAVLWRALGRAGEPRDASVTLEKHIPQAAGLGGGSADAAAALVALNRLWRGGRPLRDLLTLAAEIGSDVPFFLHGGTALAVGRGEEVYPLTDVRRMGVVVVKPAFGVATADAYRWLDEDRARNKDREPGVPPGLDVGWASGPLAMINDLEPAVGARHAGIGDIVAACRDAGAKGVAMSGSGSAVFAVFPLSRVRGVARRLARADRLVIVTRTLSRREAAGRLGL
jgi:4-diphosphocytidyl-2-C-methyl-D-erythritol kinase